MTGSRPVEFDAVKPSHAAGLLTALLLLVFGPVALADPGPAPVSCFASSVLSRQCHAMVSCVGSARASREAGQWRARSGESRAACWAVDARAFERSAIAGVLHRRPPPACVA